MGARIFLVGSGGREHALAWKLAGSELVEMIVVAPGNPGIATVPKVRCVPIGAEAIPELVAAAVAEKADLVVCAGSRDGARRGGSATPCAPPGIAFFGPSDPGRRDRGLEGVRQEAHGRPRASPRQPSAPSRTSTPRSPSSTRSPA